MCPDPCKTNFARIHASASRFDTILPSTPVSTINYDENDHFFGKQAYVINEVTATLYSNAYHHSDPLSVIISSTTVSGMLTKCTP